ncbi:MAG TPA: BON domain-containing protein [Candidatus Koribacter sp.]|jgi:hyperosmotically inducible protein
MRNAVALVFLLFCAVLLPAQSQQVSPSEVSPNAEARIVREVRHELLMLPYYGVFDIITYQVNGSTVTLNGAVVRPVLKSDAENAVKHIEGVTAVNNQIETLPPSPMDDRIRIAEFRAIYGFPALQKYDLGVIKPIRIIVKNGHVSLEGVVDSQADKDMAGIRANGVPGIFEVKNNLQVVPNDDSKKKK